MRLHIQQASLQAEAPVPERVAGLDTILARGADVVGFTEATAIHPELATACRRHNYRPIFPTRGDVAMAVRRPHRVMHSGTIAVTEHGPRVLLTAVVAMDGELVSFTEAHWITRRTDPHDKRRMLLTGKLGTTVAASARGSRLGFWLGDTNDDDTAADASPIQAELAAHRLTSVWDELGRYPVTHPPSGKTMDVIGSYDPDRRVSALRARTYPRLHSDHLQLSAWYSVQQHGR